MNKPVWRSSTAYASNGVLASLGCRSFCSLRRPFAVALGWEASLAHRDGHLKPSSAAHLTAWLKPRPSF